MTTIAWDGTVLAADSFMDTAGLKGFVETKIWRLTDGALFGASGDYAAILAVRDWLNGGTGKPTGVRNMSALLIDSNGVITRIFDDLFSEPADVQHGFIALGSGRDYALAAMACGKNAYQAVEIACRFDTYSASPITVLVWEPPVDRTADIQVAINEVAESGQRLAFK